MSDMKTIDIIVGDLSERYNDRQFDLTIFGDKQPLVEKCISALKNYKGCQFNLHWN